MTEIINAAPRALLRGVQDLSGRPPVYEPEALPQHLPHVFLFTERGTGVPQITIGDGLNKIYGAKSFDLRLLAGSGGYATHQTLLATVLNQNANQIMVQRLIPVDSKTARFRLSLDVLDQTGDLYLRGVDGSIQYDVDGDPLPLPSTLLGTWDMTVSGGELPDAEGIPTVAPGTPVEGNKWVNTATDVIQYYRTGAWVTAGPSGSGSLSLTVAGDSWTLINAGLLTGNVVRALENNPGIVYTSGWVQSDAALAVKSLAWLVTPIDDDITNNTTFGEGTVDLTGPRSFGLNVSKTYPIMDFEVSSIGKWGNGAGIRFSAPNINSSIPFDTRLITEQLTTMFRMHIVEKENDITSPKIIETRYGEQFIDFSLKPNAVNDRTSQEIYLPSVFDDAYVDKSTIPPTYGTFSNIHIYEANILAVMTELYNHERGILSTEMGWTPTQINDMIPVGGEYTMNFFTGVAWNGYPYESIRMATDLQNYNGVEMKSGVTHYALGGNDGTITLANYDALVAQQCNNYGDMIVKRNPNGDADVSDVPLDFMDTAKWPQSAIWDSGFSMTTKNALLVPMGRRKDIWVALSTQVIGPAEDQNTASEESSIAVTLQNAARMYPESEYYGTKTCRAIVVGHSGQLTNSTWRGLAPMTIDLAAKVATYMGASNGAWKAGFNFDISPKNHVTMFRTDTVNATFKGADVRNEDWAAGLIWIQNYDRRSLFYPGIQTVYDDDTSVLNSLFNIIAVCELEKVCERTWRDLTGIQTLTVAQFIERSDKLINDKVANRFDDKFIIVPETYLTEGDEQRGYSWSCKINFYAPNMKSVGTYTIVSRRIEDYQP